MSMSYLVYQDEEAPPFTTQSFEEALYEFMLAVTNGDPATLKYSP